MSLENAALDFRSDTFTRPSAGMREAMADAEVGDDVFREDPTVNELEERIAGLFGREASMLVPSGTMANLIGIALTLSAGRRSHHGAPHPLLCPRGGRRCGPARGPVQRARQPRRNHHPRAGAGRHPPQGRARADQPAGRPGEHDQPGRRPGGSPGTGRSLSSSHPRAGHAPSHGRGPHLERLRGRWNAPSRLRRQRSTRSLAACPREWAARWARW